MHKYAVFTVDAAGRSVHTFTDDPLWTLADRVVQGLTPAKQAAEAVVVEIAPVPVDGKALTELIADLRKLVALRVNPDGLRQLARNRKQTAADWLRLTTVVVELAALPEESADMRVWAEPYLALVRCRMLAYFPHDNWAAPWPWNDDE
jgi:hypothetical protein